MILLDGDAIVYKVGFASEQTELIEYGDVKYKRQSPNVSAEQVENAVDRMINGIRSVCDTNDVTVFLTHSDIRQNNRYKEYPGYKQTRGGVVKPLFYNNIRNYLESYYKAEIVEGIEADDALGMAQTDKTIIVSHDKDLFQIPGRHFSLTYRKFLNVEDPGKLHLYRDKGGKARLLGYGFKWFCAQMLTGDDSDNIIGLYRYGPVKVFNLLNKENDMTKMYELVRQQYKDLKESHNKFELNKKLLWIARPGYEQPNDFIRECL